MQISVDSKRLCLCLVLVSLAAACTSGPEAQGAAVDTEPFGKPFEGVGELENINPRSDAPRTIDVDATIGTKPVLLYYWIAGNPRADEVFKHVQDAVLELGEDKVELFGLVYLRNPRDVAAVGNRVGKLGITVPVLSDREFEVGKRLAVQSVPNLTIIDGDGILRLTNGASLVQQLEYKIDLEAAIERVARTGEIGTYGYLEPYFPVEELVGKRCPDFEAPLLNGTEARRYSSMLADDKVNVLIFWSVDCPHCRKSLPAINEWLKQNGEGVNVISAAKVTNDAIRTKTREFCDNNEFVFPTLVDRDLEIAQLYMVTSTPTILIIGPDGVIDSVSVSASQDFGRLIEEKKKSLL